MQARMKKAAATENAIEQIRRRYKPIAERATILYSCIADVAKVIYKGQSSVLRCF